ncbi:MAG TPA: hypothetical protein VEZ88_02080 [Steroidobacteraceae bacterium]|nr:hypothetical protein [Steroidobacteraceae bacterium]
MTAFTNHFDVWLLATQLAQALPGKQLIVDDERADATLVGLYSARAGVHFGAKL